MILEIQRRVKSQVGERLPSRLPLFLNFSCDRLTTMRTGLGRISSVMLVSSFGR